MEEDSASSFFGKVLLYFLLFMTVIVFVLNCMVPQVTAAKYETSERMVGDLAVMSDTDIQWRYSSEDLLGSPPFNATNRGQYFDGSVADAFVSGKGDAGYSRVATIDADGAHTYDSSTLIAYTNGGVYSDGLYMGEFSVNQSLTECEEAQMNVNPASAEILGSASFPRTESFQASIIGNGQDGTYKSTKSIVQGADTPSTLEFNPEATGRGAAVLDVLFSEKNGLDDESTALNYQLDVHEHKVAGGTANGSYELVKPMKLNSFEDLFGITPGNSSYVDNLTEVNETGNQTVNGTEIIE